MQTVRQSEGYSEGHSERQLERNNTNTFYDAIAEHYHLFYRDWRATVEREGSALRRLFRNHDIKVILDASCGTGTQTIALAQQKFSITAGGPSFYITLTRHGNAVGFR